MGCAPSTPRMRCRHSVDLDSSTALSSYIYDRSGTMRLHLKIFSECFPYMVRKEDPVTGSDGRTVNLIKLEGTIPIHCQGQRYNIPIIIRLPEEYPRAAPLVFVNPSKDMVFNKSHPYVDPDTGLVRSYMYLDHWCFYGANLTNVVKQLSEDFGYNPPLFKRALSSPRRPNPKRAGSMSNNEAEDAVQVLGLSREHQD